MERWLRAEEEEEIIERTLVFGEVAETQSASTELGLSIDDRRMASSGDSRVFNFLDDEIERELQRQDAEMDRFVKFQIILMMRIVSLFLGHETPVYGGISPQFWFFC